MAHTACPPSRVRHSEQSRFHAHSSAQAPPGVRVAQIAEAPTHHPVFAGQYPGTPDSSAIFVNFSRHAVDPLVTTRRSSRTVSPTAEHPRANRLPQLDNPGLPTVKPILLDRHPTGPLRPLRTPQCPGVRVGKPSLGSNPAKSRSSETHDSPRPAEPAQPPVLQGVTRPAPGQTHRPRPPAPPCTVFGRPGPHRSVQRLGQPAQLRVERPATARRISPIVPRNCIQRSSTSAQFTIQARTSAPSRRPASMSALRATAASAQSAPMASALSTDSPVLCCNA